MCCAVGSGTGVVGLVCALVLQPQCLVMTDIAEQLPLMQGNLARLQAQLNEEQVVDLSAAPLAAVRVTEYDWARPAMLSPPPPYDIIVVSDCVWPKIDNSLLINVLLTITTADTLVILAYEQRGESCRETFFQPARLRFDFQRIPTTDLHHAFRSDDIELYNIRRKIA